jgi:carboxymethylenebutenolidase
MCYEPTARPPLPPIAGGSGLAGSDEIVLEAADGARFSAFSARTDEPGAPGMVILPDVRGLHPFYRDLAVRFAEAGVHAAAMDYFGRTAGTGMRGDDFDWQPHVNKSTPEQVSTDVAATVAHLRSQAGGGAQAVYTVGFCFGGRHSFNQAATDIGLAGVIGFYGWPQQRQPDDNGAPVVLASSYRCPVLGLFGGADQGISTKEVERFRQALEAGGVTNEILVYDGAPHSFFDRSAAQHREASDDAWRRMLAFVRPGSGA